MVGSDSVAGTKTGGLFTTPENAFDAFGTGAGVEFLGCVSPQTHRIHGTGIFT